MRLVTLSIHSDTAELIVPVTNVMVGSWVVVMKIFGVVSGQGMNRIVPTC